MEKKGRDKECRGAGKEEIGDEERLVDERGDVREDVRRENRRVERDDERLLDEETDVRVSWELRCSDSNPSLAFSHFCGNLLQQSSQTASCHYSQHQEDSGK